MCLRVLIVLQLLLGGVALPPLAAQQPSAPATKVPHWDARGVGPLPWQGIACLDIDAQASAIAVGTIAPPGDPNVLLHLVTSYGHVYLRGADGKLPTEPALRLETEKGDWHFQAVGDFNGDRRLDVALLSYGMHGQTAARVFYNRGKADKPFDDRPDAVIPLNPARKDAPFTLLRDTLVVCDWNGDGIEDLVVGRGQSQEVLILLGGRQGLDAKRSRKIALDYRTHYETGLFVGDFNGDGRPDLAIFGYTLTGVGWNGPPATYIWLQPPASKAKPEPGNQGQNHPRRRETSTRSSLPG